MLTVRDDPIKWWHSTRRTLYKPSDRWLPFISRVLSTEGEQQELFMWERQLLWEGIYQGRFLEEGVAVKVYENHIREVNVFLNVGQHTWKTAELRFSLVSHECSHTGSRIRTQLGEGGVGF